LAVMLQTAKHFFRRGPQVNHFATQMQMLSIDVTQHGTTACRQNAVVVFAQIIQDVLFNVTKALLPFPIEELANGAPQTLLNDDVGIEKRQAESTPHLSADGRFARSREANKNDKQKKKLKER